MVMKKKRNNVKDLLLSFFVYSSASVFGPLLVIGGIGFAIYKIYYTNVIVLIISVFVAFVFTNVLLFKKLKGVNSVLEKYKKKEIKVQENKIKEKIDNKNKKKKI
jgi:multidrug efflux pump subunit AcrB